MCENVCSSLVTGACDGPLVVIYCDESDGVWR